MFGGKPLVGHWPNDVNTSGKSLILVKKLVFSVQDVFTLWGRS
jgi:hypothetical protein